MSKESSKSTSTGASNSTRRTSQPLDDVSKLLTNDQESGYGDLTNSIPIVGEAETTKGAGSTASAEQESPISEAVEEIKCHQKQEMVLTLPASQKSGAKYLDSGDPIKNSVDVIVRESERKNTIIKSLEVELATCKHHESELQEEVNYLREENEKLEYQLIDKQEETNRTREDHENEIASLESQLKVKEDEVKVAKSQLAVVEKKNEDEKQKLIDSNKTLEDQRNELESTVSKLQEERDGE